VEGSLDTAKVLLGHRLIDVNIQAEYGSTALHYAAKNNFPEIVDALLAAGANPDLCDLRGGTALQRAIDENVISVVQKMINWNVKLDTTDRFDRNLLHSAAINGRYTILEMLLRTSNVPDINAQGSNGETPLHDAAKMGYVKSAKVLLDHGARTDILDKSGKTPVRYAKDMKRVKILELLRKAREEEQEPITRGIGHSDTFTKNVDMPLYVAVQTETLELIKKKIQTASSAELNQRGTDWGQTPLHYACSYSRPDVMALLLDAKADINARDNLERTALHIACQNNSASALECVQVLVNYGADLDLIWEGVTASQFALNVGNGGVAVRSVLPKHC
jgi:ankyrin repeat domain-containing protein 50